MSAPLEYFHKVGGQSADFSLAGNQCQFEDQAQKGLPDGRVLKKVREGSDFSA